ncbi:6-phospho-3-hexuloisomerase [Gracilibacillus alcaliphilus]|uniref:6-phospho-3-hexuloisomerase n=1 Tax=Gracilibacillus alcaliphilus TaxID=1401441 RepID=UPI001957F29A|nr:6-phospho-3-hexuloisomerase [Gracilibacillus alcaliphilus]MBM7675776.1 6-phospho-3-hexuloisomerase [Gracilibacillus alcaliphilus]
MKTTQYVADIVQELSQTTPFIADAEAEKLADQMLASKKVFVAGAGRSGLMGKAFVMRMMHMGIDAYVVGETVTANLEKGDLLIIGSGSGETKTLGAIAQKAKSLGGTIAAVTISPQSTIGQLADLVVELPGVTKDQSEGNQQTIQPMGSLFEQMMLLFYDALILRCMEKKGLDSQQMYGKHANLE